MLENSGVSHIVQALAFAAERHRDQRRKDCHASPYINHPIALARVLCEQGIQDTEILCAALLHDVLEDTETRPEELQVRFGSTIAAIVQEVSDDKRLPKAERKRLQILHAGQASHPARLVKLADKICNLHDLIHAPPVDWDLARRRAYFDWAKAVVDQLRGTHAGLEQAFDILYAQRP